MRSEWVLPLRMLRGYPMNGRELLEGPFAAKAAEAAVLFSSEWTGWTIVNAGVVDVCHTSLNPKCEAQSTGLVAGKHGAGVR